MLRVFVDIILSEIYSFPYFREIACIVLQKEHDCY